MERQLTNRPTSRPCCLGRLLNGLQVVEAQMLLFPDHWDLAIAREHEESRRRETHVGGGLFQLDLVVSERAQVFLPVEPPRGADSLVPTGDRAPVTSGAAEPADERRLGAGTDRLA